MGTLLQDLRYATRMLAKQPAFTAIAVLTLALGIGANTAIFSVINAVLLRPLPFPNADRIMFLSERDNSGREFSVSCPDYLDWKRDNTVFEHLAVTRRESRNLSGIPGREAERVSSADVSDNFFKVIGLSPQLGRTFSEEEEKAGGPQAVVISDRLWQRAFNRDPSVLGRAVSFHNQSFTVVGVMPPQMTSPQDTDAWFSIMRRINSGTWQERAFHPMLYVWGRLKPAISLEQARSEMNTIAARLEKAYPNSNKDVGISVKPLLENLVGKYRTNLALLLGAVGLVLLIACANLANLFAARGSARAREFAIRAAVGATRGQIIRQLLIESFVVALLGGVVGFFMAAWLRDAIVTLAPHGVPRFHEILFDLRVLGFSFLVASLTAVLFGLWPAWQTSRADVQVALKSGSHGSGEAPSARLTRDCLVISEIALTLTLLIAAALVLKSFARMQSFQLGYEPRGLLTARIELPFTKYSKQEQVSLFSKNLLDRVRALPGVESAAIGSNPPLFGSWQIGFFREGTPEPERGQAPDTEIEVVAGDYFSTFKVPLLRGRALNDQDTKSSPLVIVIDQEMAERYFPGEDPVGKRLFLDDPDGEGEQSKPFEIVGVVARVKTHGFDEMASFPLVYFSQAQVKRTSLVLFVRSGAAIKSLEKTIRDIVVSIDPSQPVFDVRTMLDRVDETWAAQRLLTFLLLIFAGLALVLAAIGLYGVLAYTAAKRFREIGVRLALGAQPSQIRSLILGHGMGLLAIGGSIGLVGAIALSRVIQKVLFEVKSIDPNTFVLVAAVLAFTTFIACWIPARRASRVDPLVALREE
jgi:putative ABC transport system permease protein